MGFIISGLSDFAARVIARAKRGPRPSFAILNEIRETCIVNAKNSTVAGLPIEQEADMLRQGIDDLDKFLKSAIAKGWETGQR